MREHLFLCGNKTDRCPNCRLFIRRAVFAYHFENNCADLDEATGSVKSKANSADTRQTSRSQGTSGMTQCEWCRADVLVEDHDRHKVMFVRRTYGWRIVVAGKMF